MKRTLKIVSGFAVVVALSCLLAAPAQARTFVSVNVGGYGYGGYAPYCAPAFYPGYCYRASVYYRPTFAYYYAPAVRFFRDGYFWR
jgi:hypothetical protein